MKVRPHDARTSRARFVSAAAVAACTAALSAMLMAGGRAAADPVEPNLLVFDDPSGQVATFTQQGFIDLNNPFFQDLGTNGRRCITCHQPGNGWSVAAASVQARFAASDGLDPIFHSNDGTNCEGAAPHSTAERQAASSLLLTRGLIRVGLDVPPGADFAIDEIDDPFHCSAGSTQASLYRRPLPAANLRFLSAVMWDGRESSSKTTILQDLAHQALDATLGHAQAQQAPTPEQINQIVSFETALFTAQLRDSRAGALDAQHATGGPVSLWRQPFFLGINDPLTPGGPAFNENVFTIFNGWRGLSSSSTDPYTQARLSVARGQTIFNTRPIAISGVSGLNGATVNGVTVPASFTGTCSTCHDSPNAGSHSVKLPLDLGTSDPSRATYLPVYTLRNLSTQETVRTTDPGRAMITGRWSDISRFKGPVLRGLAARAPYFHNGLAATLEQAVDFYDTRFNLGLTPQEKADLVAFLRSL